MRTEYDFQGLDKFEKAIIDTIKVKFPKEIEKILFELANELVANTKKRTPVDEGRLRNGWRISGIKKKGNEFYIEVFNNVNYSEYVENGHKTSNGGFVKGKKMLTISTKLLNTRLNQKLRIWLNKMLEELTL